MKIPSTNHAAGYKPAVPVHGAARKSETPQTTPVADARAANAAVPSTPAASGNPRLEAFAKKIEARFQNAIATNNLTPRQHEALQAEHDRFQTMLSRFQNAYLNGQESAGMDPAQGMQKLLEHFGKSVTHILSGGTPAAPEGTPASGTGTPGGDAANTRGRIDTLG